jgi:hypothetical protein
LNHSELSQVQEFRMSDIETGLPEHFHYHSFPRRGRKTAEEIAKGLKILGSIVKSGLLLTPEKVEWPGEHRGPSKRAEPIVSFDRRVCFTHLHPSEILKHADHFGIFSVEFDNPSLRVLGAMPVFYVPVSEGYVGYEGLGVSIAARIADFQNLLERLETFRKVALACPNPNAPVLLAPDGTGGILIGPAHPGAPAAALPKDLMDKVRADKGDNEWFSPKTGIQLGLNNAGLHNLLQILTYGIQSFEIQLNNLRKFGGLFYPCERLNRGDPLAYYQQREWRILGGLTKENVPGTRKPTDDEKARFLAIDSDFFGKQIELRSGPSRVVEECELLINLEGKHPLAYARRVVCPKEVIGDVKGILAEGGFDHLSVVENPA